MKPLIRGTVPITAAILLAVPGSGIADGRTTAPVTSVKGNACVGGGPPDRPRCLRILGGGPMAVRGCPNFTIGGSLRARQVRRAASIRCSTVRRLIRGTYSGRADGVERPRVGRPTYRFRGGWRCSTGAGGVGCGNVGRGRLNVIDGLAITAEV
jgi:hypothetical protein